ncbi:MAG: acetylglutamate kinase [Bacteroidota bacterium]
MREELTVVKVGGKVLEQHDSLEVFVAQFAAIEGKKLLVHGGGILADKVLAERGITPQMIQGRRITDEQTLETVVMVYGGLVNKKLVTKLNACGVKAAGLTGADALTVESVKRPAVPVDYGYAGDVVAVHPDLLKLQLSGGFVPVVAPISATADGQLLNTNADTMATEISIELSKHYDVTLIYGFEITGVMEDIADANSLVKRLDRITYLKMLTDGKIHSGMVPKLDNAFRAAPLTSRTLIAHYGCIGNLIHQAEGAFTEIIGE